MQDFAIGSDLDSDPLIKMYVFELEICPLNGYSTHLGKVSKFGSESVSHQNHCALGMT